MSSHLSNFFPRDTEVYSILNHMQEGVVILNAESTIVFCNDAYGKILEVPPEKVIGKKVSVIEPHALALQVLKTGRLVIGMYEEVKSLKKHIVVNMIPVVQGKKIEGVVCIFTDYTDYIRLKQENDHLVKNQIRMTKYNEKVHKELLERKTIHPSFDKILSVDPIMVHQLHLASKIAPTDVNVLIEGESGVGKELFARAIHAASKRHARPFIALNCAALPESLAESELFGYAAGSFTGAQQKGKKGKFEMANGGTLFLDEIGEMPLNIQAKLLRVIQEGEYYPVGGEKPVKVDVRIIAATNRNLFEQCQNKRFRFDLFYRLNEFRIEIPPLRNRIHDILYLAEHFLNNFNNKYKKELSLSNSVRLFFQNYFWPGNVRELENVIRHSVIIAKGNLIMPEDLPSYMATTISSLNNKNKDYLDGFLTYKDNVVEHQDMHVNEEERERIINALKVTNYNRSKAMKILGVSRRTFYNKLKKYNITLK